MEIVIKIPESIYKIIQKNSTAVQADGSLLENAVLNGTPLPKCHGRIGDLDIILTWLVFNGIIDKLKCGEVTSVFKKATILEKNKESE